MIIIVFAVVSVVASFIDFFLGTAPFFTIILGGVVCMFAQGIDPKVINKLILDNGDGTYAVIVWQKDNIYEVLADPVKLEMAKGIVDD